jgi:hypothetical protein
VPDTESTATIHSPATQDFSESDDEILDNFAEGPQPGDPPPAGDTHDDGLPMGLGGERGKQSEPASSTLEADIVNGTTRQPGETSPPGQSADRSPPVQGSAGETGAETSPEPSGEPETPEFPPALLQMAGLADADAAKAAGFQDSDALFAAIRWRSQLLTPGAQPAVASVQEQVPGTGVYRRPTQQPPAPVFQEPTPKPEESAGVTPFELPADKRDMLDEDLLAVLDQMNAHYQQEFKTLRSSAGQREAELARQQAAEEESRFDAAVQALGGDWEDVFGEGSGADLQRAGHIDPVAMTNFNHRALLFEAVEAVREVNAKQGYKPMTLEQEVHWALMQRYPDKFRNVISGNSQPSGRRGVTASRPTQRKMPPGSQNQKVLADVNAMLRKKGSVPLDMGHGEEEFDGDI